MSLWKQMVAWTPAVILWGIVVFVYTIHYLYCIQHEYENQKVFQVIFHLLALLLFYTMIVLLILEPGYVSQDIIEETWLQWDDYLNKENERTTEFLRQRKSQKSQLRLNPQTEEDKSVVEFDEDDDDELDDDYKLKLKTQRKIELLEKPGRRFCKRCCIPKPVRTHHCSQCRTCWMKMDHHCQWINNCVALNNYKFFFLMVFYGAILLIMVCVNQFKVFTLSILNEELGDLELFLIVLHYYFVLLLAILITGFLIFHIFLICENKTTLEFLEDKPDRSNYNLGLFQNLKAALGNNPLIWLVPI